MATIKEIPSSGSISSSDPYTVHSRRHGTEGYDVSTPIQLSPINASDTNIWARFKPVVPLNDHPGDLTDAERAAVNFGLSLFYDGSEYMSGLNTLNVTKSFNVVDAVTEIPKCLWQYSRRPGASDWKRLTDWAGYEADARPPITPPGDFILYNTDQSITIRGAVTGIHTVKNLSLADFPYLNDLYICVIIYRKRLSTGVTDVCGYATASASIGSGQVGALDITIKRTELQFANPTAYSSPQYVLCAATSSKPSFSDQQSDCSFYPLPTDRPLTGSISLSSASTITARAYAISTRNHAVGLDINRFLPKITDNEYFGISDGLWVFCEFSSSNGTAQNIPLASLSARVRQTLSSGGMLTNPITINPSDVYTQSAKGGAYTRVLNTLSIPASGSVFVILDLSNMPTLSSSGVSSRPTVDHGTFFANIGRIGSSSSDFTGAMTININIHPSSGVLVSNDDNSALLA